MFIHSYEIPGSNSGGNILGLKLAKKKKRKELEFNTGFTESTPAATELNEMLHTSSFSLLIPIHFVLTCFCWDRIQHISVTSYITPVFLAVIVSICSAHRPLWFLTPAPPPIFWIWQQQVWCFSNRFSNLQHCCLEERNHVLHNGRNTGLNLFLYLNNNQGFHFFQRTFSVT